MTCDVPARSLTLYHHPSSPNCIKVRALAYELGVALRLSTVNIFQGGARTPGLRALNPNGLVPVLVDDDFVLWESNAILSYLAELQPSFMPATARERANVARWLHWESAHLGQAVRRVAFDRVVRPLTNQRAFEPAAAAAASFLDYCGVLEATLGCAAYLTERLSAADFAVACLLNSARGAGLEVDGFPGTQRWFRRMLARDSVRRALAESRFLAADWDETPGESRRH